MISQKHEYYRTPDRCKFHSITADIQKYLRQAQLIGNDIFMEYILCINIKLLLFRMYRFLYNCI